MKNYKELTNKQKIDLLDKLVNHAENIDSNSYVILNRNSIEVKEALEHSKYFLKILDIELRRIKLNSGSKEWYTLMP